MFVRKVDVFAAKAPGKLIHFILALDQTDVDLDLLDTHMIAPHHKDCSHEIGEVT